jgi:hypothetical protein
VRVFDFGFAAALLAIVLKLGPDDIAVITESMLRHLVG